MELRPALAGELPGIGDGGRTYTYTLREGVAFSDGTALDAEDVVFTYETILDEKTNNPSKGELDALDSVTARGEDTVVFRLKCPYAAFAERTVLPIASKEAAAGQDVNTGPCNTEPVGTGPYVLTGWSRGEKLTFEANPGYWGGAPEVEKLTMAVIKDDDIRATRLRSGDRLRQEHALAYAADAKEIGIDITVESGTWEAIEPRMKDDAVLSGGGSPADPDFDLYPLLHSSLALDGFNNMAACDAPDADRALEEARRTNDRAARAEAYATVQRELARDPGYTFLTHIDHVYVMDDAWQNVTTQVEPHDHGLGAGPWWNVEDWRPEK